MSKCPGFYYDIGRKARDLLYRDYAQSANPFHYDFLDLSFDLSCRVRAIVPGLNAAIRLVLPDCRKVELQYSHDYFGLTAGVTLAANPALKFSSVIGTGLMSLGTDLAYDTGSQELTKCNAGVRISTSFLGASLSLNDIGDTINATCFHTLHAPTRTAIAAELMYGISEGNTEFALGTQHAPLSHTMLKARLSTNGKAGALVQQQLWSKFFVTVAGEVNANNSILSMPQIGFSMALRA